MALQESQTSNRERIAIQRAVDLRQAHKALLTALAEADRAKNHHAKALGLFNEAERLTETARGKGTRAGAR